MHAIVLPYWRVPLSPRRTPDDSAFPWLKPVDVVRAALPENPAISDYAKAYADMVGIYQAQRQELMNHMTHRTMPIWGKALTAAVIVQSGAILAIIVTLLRTHAH